MNCQEPRNRIWRVIGGVNKGGLLEPKKVYFKYGLHNKFSICPSDWPVIASQDRE